MGRKYKSKKINYSKRIKKHLRSRKRRRSRKKRIGGGRGRQGPGGWTTWEGPGFRPSTSGRRPAPPPSEPEVETYESSRHAGKPSKYWRRNYHEDPRDTVVDRENVFERGTAGSGSSCPSTKSPIGKKKAKSRPPIYGSCKICRKGKGKCGKRGREGHLKER